MDHMVDMSLLSERTVEIPVPTEAWHHEMDESVEFEVQQVSVNPGHFGVNYRRC